MSIKLISLMVALVTVCANGASLNNGKAPCSITGTGSGKPAKAAKIDLLFVVNFAAGRSMYTDEKQSQKFLRDLVNHLEIGPSNVLVSLVIYGWDVVEKWTFNNYTTNAALDNALKTLDCTKCKRGLPDTAAALKYAREKSFTAARPDSKKFVVVMANGKSTTGVFGASGGLVDEATDLKDSVDAVIAIGVGSYNQTELELIASHSSLVFHVTGFDKLEGIESSLINKYGTWTEKEKQKCNEKIDMLLIVDMSGSITDLGNVESFLQKLVGEFEIGPSKTQVSVLMFASRAVNGFCFNNSMSIDDVKNQLKNLKCSTCGEGQTIISNALKKAAEKSFTSKCGARPGAKRLTLLFTNGKASESPDEVQKAAEKLKTESPVITIGVGEFLKTQKGHKDLKAIATSPRLVFEAVSFGNLPFIEKVVGARSCRAAAQSGAKSFYWTPTKKDCKINHCKNGAACTDSLVDSYCTCLPGFEGKDCGNCKEPCVGMQPGLKIKNPYDKCESIICDTNGRSGNRYTTLECTDKNKIIRPSCQKFCLHWQKCERSSKTDVKNMQCCNGKVPPLTTVAP